VSAAVVSTLRAWEVAQTRVDCARESFEKAAAAFRVAECERGGDARSRERLARRVMLDAQAVFRLALRAESDAFALWLTSPAETAQGVTA
jgi:hypothetical protein